MLKADHDGPRCPATGRTIAEELHAAVHLLATVAPYDREGVRYNDAEYRAYCDGYYRAVAQAGAVMDLAMTRRRTRVKDGRADNHYAKVRSFTARDTRANARRRARGAPGAPDQRGARVSNRRARD